MWYAVLQPGMLSAVLGISASAGAALPPDTPREAAVPVRAEAPAAPFPKPMPLEKPRVTPPLDMDQALRLSQAAVGRQIGDYALFDREGRRLRLSDYRGKPLIVNFVYTGCSQVCPTTTRFLAQAIKSAQQALGADKFNAVTIGFNVPFDNPLAMKNFATRHALNLPHWEFLSPERETVAALTADFGFGYAYTAGGFDHLTQVTLVDPQGRIVRQIYGDSFELPILVEPLKQLVAGQPTLADNAAQVLDKIRILCTVYDPALGRYRLNYGLFVAIFVGLSVIGSTGYVVFYEWRRGRRAGS